MKTAEKILKEKIVSPFEMPSSELLIIEAMKVYAREVAQQALIDAAERAEIEDSMNEPVNTFYRFIDGDFVYVNKHSITTTPINTP